VTVAISLLPSADEATADHRRLNDRAIQFVPLSVEVKIGPLLAAATSLPPSADEATEVQARLLSLAVQFVPPSVEV